MLTAFENEFVGIDTESNHPDGVAAGPPQTQGNSARRTDPKPPSVFARFRHGRTRLATDEMPAPCAVASSPMETSKPGQTQEVQSTQIRTASQRIECTDCLPDKLCKLAKCSNGDIVRQSVRQNCNEFITVFSEDVRLNWAHEREPTA
jgi:hypothetical protein